MPTSPELEKRLPKELESAPDRFSAEVEKQFQEIGAQVTPTSPPTIRDTSGQVIAQSIPTSPASTTTVTIPVNQSQAQTWSQGTISDSSTWLGVTILRRIKQALFMGWKIVIGVKK